MIANALVTKVYKTDKDKAGVAFKTKDGKPYSKIAIKTDKTGDDWYSTLLFKADSPEAKLTEGSENLFVFEEKNGFKNFRIAGKFDLMEQRVSNLEQWVKSQSATQTPTKTSAGTKVPDFSEVDSPEIKADDIPWD